MSRAQERFAELSPDELQLLKERAEALQRTETGESNTDLLEVLTVESRGHRFAVPLLSVEGLVELTSIAPVPSAPGPIRGMVGFRGEILLAVELSSVVGVYDGGIADLRRVIALTAEGRKLAIIAERTLSVETVTAKRFLPDPITQYPFVTGTDETFVSLLNPAALISYIFDSIREVAG